MVYSGGQEERESKISIIYEVQNHTTNLAMTKKTTRFTINSHELNPLMLANIKRGQKHFLQHPKSCQIFKLIRYCILAFAPIYVDF